MFRLLVAGMAGRFTVMARAVQVSHVMVVVFVPFIQNHMEIAGFQAGFRDRSYFCPVALQRKAFQRLQQNVLCRPPDPAGRPRSYRRLMPLEQSRYKIFDVFVKRSMSDNPLFKMNFFRSSGNGFLVIPAFHVDDIQNALQFLHLSLHRPLSLQKHFVPLLAERRPPAPATG